MNTSAEITVERKNAPIDETHGLGRLKTGYLLAIILLVGVVLRGYLLDARSVWFDEAFCCRMIEFPFSELLDRTAQDNHPPLYFFLLKIWGLCFGHSIYALRSLSVVFGSVTVIGMYLFTREAYANDDRNVDSTGEWSRSRERALMVAAMVALSVFQIRWSWEIRMYTLGTALAVFSSWAMFRALHAQERSAREWSAYGLLALVFLYTHYYAIFSVAAQGFFILGYLLMMKEPGRAPSRLRYAQLKKALIAAVIIVIGYAPWLPYFLQQRSQVQRQFWIPSVTGWRVADTLYEMFLEPENASNNQTYSVIVALACGGILISLLWRCRAADVYLFIGALLPFTLSVLISAFDTSIFYARYFLFAQLFLLAGLAVSLTRIPFGWVRAAIGIQLLANMILIDVSFWEKLDIVNKPGAREAAAFVSAAREPNEPVVVNNSMFYLAMLNHLENREGWRAFNNGNGLVHYEGLAVITPGELVFETDLESLADHRVWVVSGFGSQLVPIPPNWTLTDERRFPEAFDFLGEVRVMQFTVNRGTPK